jgi:ribonuclease HII
MSVRKQKFEIPKSPDLSFEFAITAKGSFPIAGLDEAGRGAWAGPVCAGAVILPIDPKILQNLSGVRDSKQLNVKQREFWAGKIKQYAISWGIAYSDHEEIDQIGIMAATRLAMKRALMQLLPQPTYLLIDALRLPDFSMEQTSLIKGDQRSLSIAAASVLAKTARDAWMREIEHSYPGYGFAQHKGYGTRLHQMSLETLGPSPIHRMSFKPLQKDLFQFQDHSRPIQ